MTRLHLLQAVDPFSSSLQLATEPYPQKITGYLLDCQLQPTLLEDGSVMVCGTYEILVGYTTPSGEKKEVRETQTLENKISVTSIPELQGIAAKLAPEEHWELSADISEPRIATDPVRPQGTIVTDQGIGSLSLIPRAVSIRIEGNIVLDGWLVKTPKAEMEPRKNRAEGPQKPQEPSGGSPAPVPAPPRDVDGKEKNSVPSSYQGKSDNLVQVSTIPGASRGKRRPVTELSVNKPRPRRQGIAYRKRS